MAPKKSKSKSAKAGAAKKSKTGSKKAAVKSKINKKKAAPQKKKTVKKKAVPSKKTVAKVKKQIARPVVRSTTGINKNGKPSGKNKDLKKSLISEPKKRA